MQPVLIQRFDAEFMILAGHNLVTSAVPGSILIRCDPKNKLPSERQTKHCSHMSKLLNLMRWTTLATYCHMIIASELHYKAMLTKMNNSVVTRNQELFLKPAIEFVIHGLSYLIR